MAITASPVSRTNASRRSCPSATRWWRREINSMVSFTASAAHVIGRVTEALEPLPPAPERTVRRMEPRLSATDQPRGQPERRRTTHLGELDLADIEQNWIESSRVASTAWETVNAPLLATVAGTVLWLRHNCTSCCWKPRQVFHAPLEARFGSYRGQTSAGQLPREDGSLETTLEVCPSLCHRGEDPGRRQRPLDSFTIHVYVGHVNTVGHKHFLCTLHVYVGFYHY